MSKVKIDGKTHYVREDNAFQKFGRKDNIDSLKELRWGLQKQTLSGKDYVNWKNGVIRPVASSSSDSFHTPSGKATISNGVLSFKPLPPQNTTATPSGKATISNVVVKRKNNCK
eukprot:Pgem_evm9s8721